MQALKTIADSAYSAARSPPNATLKAGNAYVCGTDVVYVASDDRIACLEVSPPSTQGAAPSPSPPAAQGAKRVPQRVRVIFCF